MNNRGFSLPVVIVFVVFLIGLLAFSYNLGIKNSKLSNDAINKISQVISEPERPYCYMEGGCWFETFDGKLGYGELQGYYKAIKKGNLSCDGFLPLEQTDVFYNLKSRDYDDDTTTLVLSLDLKNLSNSLKNQVISSNKNNPVNLKVVQLPKGGHGYEGCMPSDAVIVGVDPIKK